MATTPSTLALGREAEDPNQLRQDRRLSVQDVAVLELVSTHKFRTEAALLDGRGRSDNARDRRSTRPQANQHEPRRHFGNPAVSSNVAAVLQVIWEESPDS